MAIKYFSSKYSITGLILIVAAVLTPSAALLAALRPVAGLSASLHSELLLGAMIFRVMAALLGLVIIGLNWLPVGESAAAKPVRKTSLIILGLIMVAALALRLYRLDAGLWLDEMTTYLNYVKSPFGVIVTTYDSQNQHFVFSLMARLSVLVFGDSAAALRVPAVLFGVGSIVTLYLLGRELAGEKEGLLAAALFTFSYHHIWFSQNARGYTGLLFWTLLSSYFMVRGINENRPRLWLWYAVSAALGVYTHLTMFFPIFGQFVVYAATLLVRWRKPWPGRWWGLFAGFGLAGLLVLALYGLVLPQLLDTITEKQGDATFEQWENPLWTALEIVRGLRIGFAGGAAALAAVTVFGLGAWNWLRTRPALLGLLFIPTVFGAAVMVITDHNLWPRFFFFAFGFGVLVVIRGVMVAADILVRLARRPEIQAEQLGLALGVAMVAVSALSVPLVYGPKQDYQGALAYIESTRQPGDAVVVAGITAFAYKDFYPTDWTAVETVQALDEVRGQAARTWLLYTFPPHMQALYPDVLASVEQEFEVVEQFPGTLNGGSIFVCRYSETIDAAAKAAGD